MMVLFAAKLGTFLVIIAFEHSRLIKHVEKLIFKAMRWSPKRIISFIINCENFSNIICSTSFDYSLADTVFFQIP